MFWMQAAMMAVGSVTKAMDEQADAHNQFEQDLLASTYKNTELRTEQFNTERDASIQTRQVGREALALTGKTKTSAAARGIGGEALNSQLREVGRKAGANRAYIQSRVNASARSTNADINQRQKKLKKAYNELTFNSTFDFIHNQGMAAGGLAFLKDGVNKETLQNHINAHTGQPQVTEPKGGA